MRPPEARLKWWVALSEPTPRRRKQHPLPPPSRVRLQPLRRRKNEAAERREAAAGPLGVQASPSPPNWRARPRPLRAREKVELRPTTEQNVGAHRNPRPETRVETEKEEEPPPTKRRRKLPGGRDGAEFRPPSPEGTAKGRIKAPKRPHPGCPETSEGGRGPPPKRKKGDEK